MRLEQKIAKLLIKHKHTLAVAESCTGGLLADRLTNIPGSSAFFWLGIVAYDNAAKTKVLRVSPALLKKHGAVSAPVAKAMAQHVRQILNTHFGIGITGIAGPGGGTKIKPVGLTFIAVSNGQKTLVKKFCYTGTRISIKRQAAQQALTLLLTLTQKS